jgi:hypothetical protein
MPSSSDSGDAGKPSQACWSSVACPHGRPNRPAGINWREAGKVPPAGAEARERGSRCAGWRSCRKTAALYPCQAGTFFTTGTFYTAGSGGVGKKVASQILQTMVVVGKAPRLQGEGAANPLGQPPGERLLVAAQRQALQVLPVQQDRQVAIQPRSSVPPAVPDNAGRPPSIKTRACSSSPCRPHSSLRSRSRSLRSGLSAAALQARQLPSPSRQVRMSRLRRRMVRSGMRTLQVGTLPHTVEHDSYPRRRRWHMHCIRGHVTCEIAARR